MSAGLISLLGVFIGLGLLIYLAYKGFPILLLGVISTLIVIVFSGQPIPDLLTGTYMKGFGSFAEKNWLIFLGSAVFGQLMADSGAAKFLAIKGAGLARKFPGKEKFLAIVTLMTISGVLTYGGISLFVLVFTMVAIAKEIYSELDIPWHLYTTQTLSSGVITMTMLPGTPSIQNIVPTEYLGTTTMAAPLLGFLLSAIALTLGLSYIAFRLKQAEQRGEGFYPTGKLIAESNIVLDRNVKDFSVILTLLPSIVLFFCLNVLNLGASISLLITVLVAYLIFRKDLDNLYGSIQSGSLNALNAMAATCAVVGFGAVVSAVPAFEYVISALDNIPGPPIVQLILAINIAAGVTGSATAGVGIGLDILAERFLAQGIPAEVIHRIGVISAGGLDSLPHNGAVINTLSVTKLTHKQAYFHYFFMTVLIPIVCAIIGAILYQIGIW